MKDKLGGVIHTYQKYDPVRMPSPRQPPPDMVSPAFEHMLLFGSRRELTEEEMARAITIDPSQIQGLGPSLDVLKAMLEERKRKILQKYETDTVQRRADEAYRFAGRRVQPPKRFQRSYQNAYQTEQLYLLERLYYAVGDDASQFARQLVPLIERLGEKYEVDELAARYEFTGREPLTVPEALAVKEELEQIDELLRQLEEARENAQIALIDMEALAEFAEPGDMERLEELRQMVENYMREMAEQQGLEAKGGRFQVTPQAYKIFQSKLLERIFSELQASRSGRHTGPIQGEGAVEMQATRPYEFGDSISHMDIPQSLTNAMIRSARAEAGCGVALTSEDIEIHRTRNHPKCATCVIMDMSGSMRYDGQYVNVKRMALALQGLITKEYPGDYVRMLEMYSVAKVVPPGQVVELMPKPVTIHDPVVRLKADLSNPDVSEALLPSHFTNIQHGLQLARQHLAAQDTPNRQIILITDGLPTAHFEGSELYFLYPPHPRTEDATMREGRLCEKEGITINIFLVPSWSQSDEDIKFAYRLAERTKGRVFFTAGRDLDRYVVWDYVQRKREIIG